MGEESHYINKFIKVYPLLKGFTDDLLFYVAIDTLFLTVVKGLSAQEIVLLTTISSIFSIVCRLLLIKVIQRLGNTYSVRLGMGLLLLSAICITFGTNYFWIMLGKIIYEISWVFKDMENVMLKNNLTIIGKENQYAEIANKGMIVYAFLTFIIALSSGVLFNINPYLPMYLCILICIIANIVYFFMKDVSNHNSTTKNITKNKKTNFSRLIIAILISYALFYGLVVVGQQNSKLLIQYELSDLYNMKAVSFYLGIIVAFSRIARLLSTIIFGKIYSKLKDKSMIFLSSMLSFAFLLILLGYFCPSSFIKFFLMAIGFCLILSVRDPYRLYIQDFILKTTNPDESQVAISYMQFARKVGTTLCSLLIAAILLKWSLIIVVFVIFFLAIIEIMITFKLYQMLHYNVEHKFKEN